RRSGTPPSAPKAATRSERARPSAEWDPTLCPKGDDQIGEGEAFGRVGPYPLPQRRRPDRRGRGLRRSGTLPSAPKAATRSERARPSVEWDPTLCPKGDDQIGEGEAFGGVGPYPLPQRRRPDRRGRGSAPPPPL